MEHSALRILHIEDVVTDAELIERELRKSGFTFSMARVETKAGFLQELDNQMPDLILSDYSLPSFDGLSALALTRERCPDVPFIFISGTIGEELAIETLKRGATDYILKHRLSRLGPTVQRALQEAQERIQRKQAEADRTRLEEQLILAHKMEMIGRFAAAIAHDFNNYLSVIQGFADLIQSQYANEDALVRRLKEIHHAANSGATLVSQLMAFSRQQPITPKAIDLNQTIQAAQQLLQQLIGQQITLRLELAPVPLSITVDPTGLEQILMNLSKNARDAMLEARGALTIRTLTQPADAGFRATRPWAKHEAYAQLDIQDTGAGMTADVAAHIFEPFFTTKKLGRGTGLGLAVVYGLVTQHEGCIELDTAPGCGTTFHVYFPIGATLPAAGAGAVER